MRLKEIRNFLLVFFNSVVLICFVLSVPLIKITEAFNSEAYYVMLYVEQGTRIT